MKYIISLLTLLISTCMASAQYTEAIKRDATVYNKAYLDNDYDTYVDMSIGQIVDLGGGKASMISVAKEQAEMYAKTDMKIEQIVPEATGEVFEAAGALHVVLGQRQVLSVAGKKFETIVSYLAESTDDGKTWKFVDLTPYDQESLSLFLPSVSPELEVPAHQESVLVKE